MTGPKTDSPPPLRADRTALAGVRVLVVDDTSDTAAMMREVLSRHGAHVQSFDSADDALAAARGTRFDAVVSDLAMPGTDGLGFVAALRATHNHGTPVIFTSGYSCADDIARAHAAGAVDYLVKPVRMHALVDAIRRAVDKAAAGGA